MGSKAFVDSWAWCALIDRNDSGHSDVSSLIQRLMDGGARFVTTDYVIAESCTLVRARVGFRAADRLLRVVEQTAALSLEWIGSERFERAKQLFRKYDDQSFSFTDCTSFAVMRDLRISQVLTDDRHFRIAGFELLPSVQSGERKPT